MRVVYVMVIAAATFLAWSDAHSLTTDADQTQLSQPVVVEKRSLRTNKLTTDEERTSYANIFGIKRDFADTVMCLRDWLKNRNTIEQVAGHLKVTSFNTSDENWNALIQYVIMKHWTVKKERITSEDANAILRNMLP
ncbi:RxLR effector protein [Phytophthora megakarya]|uniref:RxLR effector protein n=1 Tax=Phytophthora megakarya TaxID=4795 RepID=A0A225W1N0_9STRA|nr:RxLR effector protein [Phytophthora megakarya]